MTEFNLARKLAFGAALLASASGAYAVTLTVGGATPVTVTNAATNPVPVTGNVKVSNTPNPALQPFHASCLKASILPGAVNDGCTLAAVPAGKVLVIEMVTAEGNVPTGSAGLLYLITTANGEDVSQYIAMTQRVTTKGEDYFAATSPVRFYADSATDVLIRLTATSFSPTGGRLQGTISGYLVDLP